MLRRRPALWFFVFCASAFACTGVHAQWLPAKPDSVDSALLQQKRAIEVYMPQEADKNPTQRYETIYVLDGDWNAQIVVRTVEFMRQVGRMPPVIVVSVPNFIDERGGNSRDNNFLAAVVDGKPKPGSAPDFLAFLKTELVPYVEKRYPANGTRVLHGHSYGGVFAFYALLHEPELFDGYLILDPAMWWWNEHELNPTLEARLPALPTQGKAIYIGSRAGKPFEYMGMSKVEPILRRKAPADLHWTLATYADESHDSLKLKGTYDALKYVYEGYTTEAVELIPASGTMLKGKPLYVTANGEPPELRYTTDGSMPNASSPKFEGWMAIADPAKTTVKLLSNRGVFDHVIPLHVKFGKVLPPARGVSAAQDESWRYAYYAAEAWPNPKRAKPFFSGTTPQDFDFTAAQRDSFTGVMERNIEIPADGYYVFGTDSPDNVRVWVAGTRLIDENTRKVRNQHSVVMPLRRGTYPIRVEFQRASKSSEVGFLVLPWNDAAPKGWKEALIKFHGAAQKH